MARNVIHIDEREFQEAIDVFERAKKSLTPRYIKNRQAYYAKKHIVSDMKQSSPSVRLADMMSVTTSKKYVQGKYSVRVGVVKNDPAQFPDFSAQALASVLEYGTEERFRKTGVFSAQSTGSVESAVEAPRRESFIRAPYERNKKPFMDDVAEALAKKIDKEVT